VSITQILNEASKENFQTAKVMEGEEELGRSKESKPCPGDTASVTGSRDASNTKPKSEKKKD